MGPAVGFGFSLHPLATLLRVAQRLRRYARAMGLPSRNVLRQERNVRVWAVEQEVEAPDVQVVVVAGDGGEVRSAAAISCHQLAIENTQASLCPLMCPLHHATWCLVHPFVLGRELLKFCLDKGVSARGDTNLGVRSSLTIGRSHLIANVAEVPQAEAVAGG
jgi:hypothetical protein